MRSLQHLGAASGQLLLAERELAVQRQEEFEETAREIALRIQIGRGKIHLLGEGPFSLESHG